MLVFCENEYSESVIKYQEYEDGTLEITRQLKRNDSLIFINDHYNRQKLLVTRIITYIEPVTNMSMRKTQENRTYTYDDDNRLIELSIDGHVVKSYTYVNGIMREK